MTKLNEQAPQPTLTADALKSLVLSVIQEHERTKQQPQLVLPPEILALLISNMSGKAKPTVTVEDIDAKVVKAFAKRGIEGVTPRIDVLTFSRWTQEGLRPREGEKAVKIGKFALFHKSQCRPLNDEDRKTLAERQARRTSDTMGKPSPVEPKPVDAPAPKPVAPIDISFSLAKAKAKTKSKSKAPLSGQSSQPLSA